AGGRRRDLRVDLVRRHLEQRLVRLDAIADLLEPPSDGALSDAFAELGHGDRYRHVVRLLAASRVAARDLGSCRPASRTSMSRSGSSGHADHRMKVRA